MDTAGRIEKALQLAVARGADPRCPPGLTEAVRYAVFPGGSRLRPRLCLATALACGDDEPELADSAAASIELMHCASLVHDYLPCFDDAPLRRGRPSVHRAFGERLAVLSGDALIVLAFETLGRAAGSLERLPQLLGIVARSVGMPAGIVAGQAWECEPEIELSSYHRAKTGALFAAATVAGAAAAGAAEPEEWRMLGLRLGEAYQVADDIRDMAGDAEVLGKPTGRDVALDRCSAARELGLAGAIERLGELVGDTAASIPRCAGAARLRVLIRMEAERFLPSDIALAAA